MSGVDFLDLAPEHEAAREAIRSNVADVLDSQSYVLGEHVRALEEAVSADLGAEHAVGVNSGTDALVLALEALSVGEGDDVLVPAYTFFATAEAVLQVGARPVFVDVDPDTYAIDVDQAAEQLTPDTAAAIPVHLFGHPAPMDALGELADEGDFALVEDNAQAYGARWDGEPTGAIGDVGCLSFYPTKNLGGAGDGGMVVTDDEAVAERVRALRTHGWHDKYEPEHVGYNTRLDEIQAAVLRAKLPHVDDWNDERRRLAARYDKRLDALPVKTPTEDARARHVYHLYVVEVDERAAVREHLDQAGIGNGVYYPNALHENEPCREFPRPEGGLPVAEAASRRTLAIPLYPGLDEDDQDRVVDALADALAEAGAEQPGGPPA